MLVTFIGIHKFSIFFSHLNKPVGSVLVVKNLEKCNQTTSLLMI